MSSLPTQLGDSRSTTAGLQSSPEHTPTVEHLSLRLHASLDLQRVAVAVANEGRRFVGCDRLSVLVLDGTACRLLAMSGVEAPDVRSNVVRRMEQTADLVLPQKLPVWRRESSGDAWTPRSSVHDEDGTPSETSPSRSEVGEALAGMQSETGAVVVCAMPVDDCDSHYNPPRSDSLAKTTVEPIGVLICEWFSPTSLSDGASAAVETLQRVSGLALRNACEHDRIPLRSTLNRLRSLATAMRRPRIWITAAVIVAMVTALAVIPIELTVTARGKLQPVERRDIFASNDGVVTELRVHHGQAVTADDVLLTLRNSDLDFEESRIAGELQTAQKRLATVQAARVELQQQAAPSRERANQLSGEEEELKELLVSLDQQRQLVIRRQADLQVKSPLTGQIITWDVEQLLAARPVQRGQVLLTVANPEGFWELRLHVSEYDIGHVLAARRNGRGDLPITFVLAAQPETVYDGRVADVSLATDAPEQFGVGVPVVAKLDRSPTLSLHPGSAVVANIRCGQRAAGYVLFHRVFEAVRRWGWF